MRLLPGRFHASRAERVISEWIFPAHIWGTVAKRHPQVLDERIRGEIDHALRDWFICCAWRGRRSLGMPSRLVDEAWHALILDSLAYVELCRQAYGTYLHHFPETLSAADEDSSNSKSLVNTSGPGTGRWLADRKSLCCGISTRDTESKAPGDSRLAARPHSGE